jgi:hypothetical protein
MSLVTPLEANWKAMREAEEAAAANMSVKAWKAQKRAAQKALWAQKKMRRAVYVGAYEERIFGFASAIMPAKASPIMQHIIRAALAANPKAKGRSVSVPASTMRAICALLTKKGVDLKGARDAMRMARKMGVGKCK